MEYHLSEHINNIHDIFLHGALNLTNLLVTVLSGQVINQLKKSTTKNTHKKKQTKWCTEEVEKKTIYKISSRVEKKLSPSEKLWISPGCLLWPIKFIMSLFKYAPALHYVH